MPAGAPVAPRRSLSPSDRSNLALDVAIGCGLAHKSRQIESARARRLRLERQHHLEQRVPRQRARRVEHLDQPLERQVLVRVGGKVLASGPGRSTRLKLGCPEVSVRSTKVLTKNPTRSSSAASVRPAIGLPIAMSVPAPSLLQQPGQRRLQHHEQAGAGLARQRRQRAVQSAPEWRSAHLTAAVARDRRPRPVGRQLDLIRQSFERLSSRTASCRASALSASASSPSAARCHSV